METGRPQAKGSGKGVREIGRTHAKLVLTVFISVLCFYISAVSTSTMLLVVSRKTKMLETLGTI